MYINTMETNEIPLFSKIDENVKERATMYVTQSKILGLDTNTMKSLLEKALEEYMIKHPL